MNKSQNAHTGARIEFRILAGFLAGFLLLVAPVFFLLAFNGTWYYWLMALSTMVFAIGLLGVMRTGQWFRFRKHP